MEAEIKDKIDQLFHSIGKFKGSKEFKELLNFCCTFHYLSPYNAMLVQLQKPGAVFAQTAGRWEKTFNVQIKQTARPLIILVPFGPVDFVFDIGDIEGDTKDLIPESILHPFNTKGALSEIVFKCLLSNLKFYGIKLEFVTYGNVQNAQIERLKNVSLHETMLKYKNVIHTIKLPEYYLISIDNKSTKEEMFAGIVHELAHFFCQHLSPVKENWWKYRTLKHNEKEFEAETVSWLVCERRGLKNPSEEYLALYLNKNNQIPNISIECILKATNMIETMLGPQGIMDGLLAKKDEYVKAQLRKMKE